METTREMAYNYTVAESHDNIEYSFKSQIFEAGVYEIHASVFTIGELQGVIYKNLDFTNQKSTFRAQSTKIEFDSNVDSFFKDNPKSFSLVLMGQLRSYFNVLKTFYLSSNMQV